MRDTSSITIIDDLQLDPFFTAPNYFVQIPTGRNDKLVNASIWIDRAAENRGDGNKRMQFIGSPESPRGKVLVKECRSFRNKPTDQDNQIDGLSAATRALQGYRDTSHHAPDYPLLPGSDEYYAKLAGVDPYDED
jgi:hypothetical protein